MKIVVVDDHELLRFGLIAHLTRLFPTASIIGFSEGLSALNYFLNGDTATILILDVDIPFKNGLEICSEVKKLDSDLSIIMLSMHNDLEIVKTAFFNGASGYLLKENTSSELLICIETVLKGKQYVSESLKKNFNSFQLNGTISNQLRPLTQSLTKTELRVLKLIAQRYNSKEIAEILCITVNSTENYRNRICQKLELDQKHNSLVVWAMEHKILL